MNCSQPGERVSSAPPKPSAPVCNMAQRVNNPKGFPLSAEEEMNLKRGLARELQNVMQRIENIKVLGYASMKEDSVTAQADCKDRHQPRILRCIEESTDAASGFTPGQQRGSDVTTGVTIPRISPRVGLSLSFKRPASQVGGQREGSKIWTEFASLFQSSAKVYGKQDGLEARDSFLVRAKFQLRGVGRIIRIQPLVLLVPMVIACLIIGLGVWGVWAAAKDQEDRYRDDATKAANDLSASIVAAVRASYKPAAMLGEFIAQYPDWRDLEPRFPAIAERLLTLDGAKNVLGLELVPYGYFLLDYPAGSNINPRGIDVFSTDPSNIGLRMGMIAFTLLYNTTFLTGPYLDTGGKDLYSTSLRSISTVMVPNVDFNVSFNFPKNPLTNLTINETTGCGPSPYSNQSVFPFLPAENWCYDSSTRRKYWGSIGCQVDFQGLRQEYAWDAAMAKYNWQLKRYDALIRKTTEILAGGGKVPKQPMVFNPKVPTQESEWTLSLERTDGWVPSWRDPLIAVTVIVAVVVGILLFLLMVKQRQHTTLLEMIVPKKVIRYLESGRRYARSYNHVTVLFSDIVAYTTLSSGLSPLEVADLLNEIYELYDRLCQLHGMYRCDVIGDAYMAVAGAPDEEDPCIAAVKAARMAQAMLDATNRFVSSGGIRIRIRIGLHSGPVVGAVVGGSLAPKFTLLGDTVNIASRMESSSEPMRVQVSVDTAKLLRLACTNMADALSDRGATDIKGKGVMYTYWLDWKVNSLLDTTPTTSPAPSAPSTASGCQTDATSAHGQQSKAAAISTVTVSLQMEEGLVPEPSAPSIKSQHIR